MAVSNVDVRVNLKSRVIYLHPNFDALLKRPNDDTEESADDSARIITFRTLQQDD